MKRVHERPIPGQRFSRRLLILLTILILSTVSSASAQVGALLWEENFNTLDTNLWTIDIGDGCDQGLCGWGNQELQSYEASNVTIEAVPGEPGNSALVLEARDEVSGGSAFTSGKIQSKNKVAVQYGMVEVRLRVPNLDTGLWPAAWMLGTSTATWPAKGEIDIMEMGHAAAERSRQGFPGAPINNYVGSNLIFYAADACSTGNPTCAASTAWDVSYNNPYNAAMPMNDRFVIYRLYWTDSSIQFSIVDGGNEHFLLNGPFTPGGESDEFQAPFYFLLNLAVGGTFTDAATNGQVTAPKPAKMYVDYVRVYEYNGQGTVTLGNTAQPEYGTFGVFTDDTVTDNELVAGSTSDIWVWDPTTTAGTTSPYEGSNVIAWNVQSGGWFGGGVQSRQPLDMSNFGDGNLKFRIKIPKNVAFRIGITDTYGNENWIDFPAGQKIYGMKRNGQWDQATIPVADIRGTLIALQSLSYPFAIAADPPSNSFQMAIDDIYWEGGGDPPAPPPPPPPPPTDTDGDGVDDANDQCPGTPAGATVDAQGCQTSATGLTVTGADSIEFFVNTPDWADVHYIVNGGGQQNVRMTQSGGKNTWPLTGLSNGDVVDYSFTYWDASIPGATSPPWESYTHGGSPPPPPPPPADSDGDGVDDTNDQCPGTPAGATVDAQGCPSDTDGDGVYDGIDQCAATPAGATVDAQGCPSDSDGDGVLDGIDQCPGTPAGATVDAQGCEIQQSLYGVTVTGADSIEFYVNTPDWSDVHYTVNSGGQQNVRMTQSGGKNTWPLTGLSNGDVVDYYFTYWDANLNGAVDTAWETYTHGGSPPPPPPPTDSDGDGVDDANDQCPSTPAGTPVDSVGCPLPTPQDVQVEAEDYVSYWDADAGNNGGAYRTDDVDIEATTDTGGGYNVGWTVAGEWLEYTVNLVAGTYDVTTRVASQNSTGAYTLSLGGTSIGSDTVPSTGGWQVWETHSVGSVTVATTGDHTLRVDITGNDLNLNWIHFAVASAPTDTDGDGVIDASDQCPGTPAGTAVDSVGCPLPLDTDGDGVPDTADLCPGTPAGTTVDSTGCEVVLGNIVPLYDASTVLEPVTQFETADALVTRFTDRARDRHAKENHYQAYDHYLSFYWEFRTAQIEIIDKVAKGGSTVRMNVTIDHPLSETEAENRWFYMGNNTLAEFCDNGTMDVRTDVQNPDPNLYYYYKERTNNCRNNFAPIAIGDKMEFEVSQFLGPVPRGRSAYYGTTFLYIVGEGIVPWIGSDHGPFVGGNTFQRDSVKIPESAWLGGHTTIHALETAEWDNHFMQMATNLGYGNGQHFVDGRRLIHTSFVDGRHVDEAAENAVFSAMANKAGTHFVNESCISCHNRNGRAAPEAVGVPLNKWVFKVADATGNPDPNIGSVLQPSNTGGVTGEGTVSIAFWDEQNGLRSPNFNFSNGTPALFSARIAPQLVGMGLLEAITEADILALEDIADANGDGISGKVHRVIDPVTGDTRVGRFGWKAATTSVRHQVAAALNTDVGVMTSVLPNPDCGSAQANCGPTGSELADSDLADMVKYISTLGIRPQRDYDDPQVQAGEVVFSTIGCDSCHKATFQTSPHHPLAELRDQTIHPYTDLLLHDMGPGLADNLGEGQATGSEWRTTPLWGLGLSACVTGGVTGTPGGSAFGVDGGETCVPVHSYLHDGRARSIEEAILWHGGEGENAKQGFENLSAADKAALLAFLRSL